jgi:protein involved in polysaccharide export with SLBB domain
MRSRLALGTILLVAATGPQAVGQAALKQVAATTAGQSVRSIPPEYRLGPGDEISVTFPLNQELNHDGPDGRFTMPLIGDLLLEGDTVNEATLAIANALREGRIVADARPSLTIRHYNASIYVGGEIHQPGVVTLSPGMDALQAVIAAGGMLDTAKTKRIALIRRTADGHASIMFIDLRSYLRGATGRVMLQPRDVVFVPKSSIAEADNWVDQYLNKLLPFNKSLNYNTGNYGATTTVVP